jgi:hypothetical protein
MLPLGKNPEWGSGHGHIPLWSWSFDINLVFISKFEIRKKKKLVNAYNFTQHKLYI